MLARKVRLVDTENNKKTVLCWTYMQKKGETSEERARARTEK